MQQSGVTVHQKHEFKAKPLHIEFKTMATRQPLAGSVSTLLTTEEVRRRRLVEINDSLDAWSSVGNGETDMTPTELFHHLH